MNIPIEHLPDRNTFPAETEDRTAFVEYMIRRRMSRAQRAGCFTSVGDSDYSYPAISMILSGMSVLSIFPLNASAPAPMAKTGT